MSNSTDPEIDWGCRVIRSVSDSGSEFGFGLHLLDSGYNDVISDKLHMVGKGTHGPSYFSLFAHKLGNVDRCSMYVLVHQWPIFYSC